VVSRGLTGPRPIRHEPDDRARQACQPRLAQRPTSLHDLAVVVTRGPSEERFGLVVQWSACRDCRRPVALGLAPAEACETIAGASHMNTTRSNRGMKQSPQPHSEPDNTQAG